MNKKDARRLALHRETLLRLDERKLLAAGGNLAAIDPIGVSRDRLCTSPLCVETTCGCAETVVK